MTKGKSAKDRVSEALRNDIENAVITSGKTLSVERLAEQYGVSRTPVREALLSLEREGFVSASPRVGFTVNPLNVNELLDIYNMRILLEKEAVSLAVPRMSSKRIEYLQSLIVTESKDYSPRNNRKFHTEIARASGSKLLAEVIESILWRRYRGSVLDSHVLHRKESEQKAHQSILDAIASGNVELAVAEMSLHITRVKYRIELLIQRGLDENMLILKGESTHELNAVHTG